MSRLLNAAPAHRPASAGFTLIEMVISVTLMSMLTLAMVDSFQGFGKQLEVLRETEEELRVDEGLVQLTHDLRNAWVVEEASTNHLNVSDAYGRVTEYWLDGDELKVKRPSGAVGILVAGVGTMSLTTQTIERLRPDTPTTLSGKWWEQADLPAANQMLTVEEDLPVSLGFTASNDAPASADVVPGIEEHVLEVGLQTLKIVAAFAAPVEPTSSGGGASGGTPPGPNEWCPGCGKKNKKCKNTHSNCYLQVWGSSSSSGGCGGSSSGTVDICHAPPGNPGNAHTITVSVNAKNAHLNHGDTLGACGGGSSSTPTYPPPANSNVVVELYEARAPNSGIPYGPMLASVTVPVSALPAGTFSYTTVASTSSGGGSSGCNGGSNKTAICHIPPGNPANAHTISVGNPAVNAHLAHGDVLGSCTNASTSSTTQVLVYNTPAVLTDIDISSMNAAIQPGRAHTLVLRLDGSGTLLLASDPLSSEVYSGVAKIESATSGYEPVAHGVARSLVGSYSVSQTQAQNVISRVTLNLDTAAGKKLSRSAVVLGQSAIENPWLGAVPGELPTLDLAGY